MKRTTITIVIMAVLLLAMCSYVVADKVQDKLYLERTGYYNYGFQEGQKAFYNSMIQSLSVDGSVTIPVTNQDNQTINVKLTINQTELIQ